jgi:hypothetical protein
MSWSRKWTVFFLACAIVMGVAAWLQRDAAVVLRKELALLQEEQRIVARLKANNAKLLAEQIPEAEMARLREDRAALHRLREEIENLKKRAKLPAGR